MPLSLMIIDDFLPNPYAFREKLLALEYPKPTNNIYYPGRNSKTSLPIPGLAEEISRRVQETLTPKEQTAHCKSRITLAGELGKADIHIDGCYWSALLYMSLPEHCQGGTDFFKHIETDTDQAILTPKGIEKLGLQNVEDAEKKYYDIMKKDGQNREKWKKTLHVPMRFNRLVLLRPWLWHTAGPGFGDSLESGRLVYLMFFNAKTTLSNETVT